MQKEKKKIKKIQPPQVRADAEIWVEIDMGQEPKAHKSMKEQPKQESGGKARIKRVLSKHEG